MWTVAYKQRLSRDASPEGKKIQFRHCAEMTCLKWPLFVFLHCKNVVSVFGDQLLFFFNNQVDTQRHSFSYFVLNESLTGLRIT